MVKTLLAVTLMSSLSAFVQASDDFRGELGLGYGNYSRDEHDEADAYNVYGRFYLENVYVGDLPRTEAAFIQHKSYVEASWEGLEYDSHEAKYTTKFNQIGLHYYVPRTHIYLGAEYEDTKSRARFDGGIYVDRESNSDWIFSLGFAPVDGLLVWTEYLNAINYSDQVNLHAKYVWANTHGSAWNFEGAVEKLFDYRMYTANVDYYFHQNLSIGFGVEVIDYDEGHERDDENIFSIRVKNYFTENFGVMLGYSDKGYREGPHIEAQLRF